jgi:Concanavalin A-like lectin/glucanases superfamily
MRNETIMRRNIILIVLVLLLASRAWPSDRLTQQVAAKASEPKEFRAGACAVDVGPESFPVLVNGGFLQNSARRLKDPIRARCLILDDGSIHLAIVVVDSCMMPRELLDRAKKLAHEKTSIPIERILISATHTHSAPAAMGALGCPADTNYISLLPRRIAESIERATKLLEPARMGWNVIDDREHTHCRRWIRRPDKMLDDPFGQRTVRANMHPGYMNADAIAPAGPTDPALTVLSVQSRNGRPIAVLANYSMHYYGAEPVSADYFGRFATALAKRINAQAVDPPFIGIMSQGTSGDQMWMDYGQPQKEPGLDAYADAVARFAEHAYRSISYYNWVALATAEAKIVLGRRVPDASRLAWANTVVGRMGSRDIPKSLPEVYAKEAIFLHQEPRRELKLQAIKIGDLGITAIPNEVFALTGLKIKAQSPFETTMNIELANGSEGYIPPPEQHTLGGYTTWPARTAGLEVQAEPKIVEGVLRLLERVAGKPRRNPALPDGQYARSILDSKPVAYWRLDDDHGTIALDSSGHARHARYEGGVAFYLPGLDAPGLSDGKSPNHAVQFAGGRLTAQLDDLPDNYSVELWFWNGLPNDVRAITGDFVSLGVEQAGKTFGADFGISGTKNTPGHLFFTASATDDRIFSGKIEITPSTWHHVALVRNRRRVIVYLDGSSNPEIDLDAGADSLKGPGSLSIGGRFNDGSRFEGKIDEIAFYDRALRAEEIAEHVRAAQRPK